MNTLIEDLQWRGMIQDIMPGTEEQLDKEMTSGYIGFDPTADSLHIGSLVPILLLVHLQKAGHRPIALVGGATGMVGDPTGKSQERALLDENTLQKNLKGVKLQLEKFLDFDEGKENAAKVVNNFDWFKNYTFLDFIRDQGKHITVNYMMAKDSVKKRLNSEVGMSFTEFSYQLIQGYDYYHLYKNENCKLQMGGSDQWGNIVTGSEFIRRKDGGEAYAFTCPLVTKADGGKFGKTEGGNIWLDAERTTPYQFYQFWLNTADADAERYIKTFTFLSKDEIEGLIKTHQETPHLRLLQKKLAEEITVFVHGKEEYELAVKTSQVLFGKGTAEVLKSLDEKQLLKVLNGVPQVTIAKESLNEVPDIVSFLAETGIFPSKGKARKAVQSGGISVNKEKIEGIEARISENNLILNNYLLIQRGKKNYWLVKLEK